MEEPEPLVPLEDAIRALGWVLWLVPCTLCEKDRWNAICKPIAADGRVLDDEGAHLALRPVEERVHASRALSEAIVLEARCTSADSCPSLLPAGSVSIAIDRSAVCFAFACWVALPGLWIFVIAVLAFAASRASVRVLADAGARRLLASGRADGVTEAI